MRDISSVVVNMMALCENSEMRNQLAQVFRSVIYTAPENMFLRWEQLSEIVQEYYHNYSGMLWYQMIVSEFTTQSLEEIQEMIAYNDASIHECAEEGCEK